jgi:hypothetical protein
MATTGQIDESIFIILLASLSPPASLANNGLFQKSPGKSIAETLCNFAVLAIDSAQSIETSLHRLSK